MSMITSTVWIPRGYPKQIPRKAEFNQDEFDRIQELANLQITDAKEGLEEAKADLKRLNKKAAAAKAGASEPEPEAEEEDDGGVGLQRTNEEEDDDLKEYDLEHYDDTDEDEDGADDAEVPESGDPRDKDGLSMFGNPSSLVYHTNNEDDPYITLQGSDGESDSEREELQILPTDNVLVAGRVEDEVAHLEFYVYEDEEDNLYVHHDVMLPAIPLCVEWVNAKIRKQEGKAPVQGNYVAVGTMEQDIEIWDLDVVDSMYPDLILGAGGQLQAPSDSPTNGTSTASTTTNGSTPTTTAPQKKKKKRQKGPTIHPTHHTTSILSLASNPHHTNLLASASADTTIKLWDLSSATPSTAAASFTHHTDKVCALAWHPSESTILLSGSYDRTVVAADMRTDDEGGLGRRRWTLDADIEAVAWDPHDYNFFFVSTEAGVVWYFDARRVVEDRRTGCSRPVWRLQAHDGPVSAFDVNGSIPGFLVTGSSDKVVKLWNLPVKDGQLTGSETSSGADATAGANGEAQSAPLHGEVKNTKGPTLITHRTLPDIGRIFSATFAPDAEVAFRLAVAGSKGTVQVWDTSTNKAVRGAFAGKVALPRRDEGLEVRDRMTGVKDLEEGDSEDEDGGEDGEGGGGEMEL